MPESQFSSQALKPFFLAVAALALLCGGLGLLLSVSDTLPWPIRLTIYGATLFVAMTIGAWMWARAVVERAALRQQVDSLEHVDQLTKLPNRTLFFDRHELVHSNARRYRRRYALLFVNLDGFKAINERFGHAVGDELLIRIARLLTHSLRKSDTIARLGGDEFAVLLSEISDHEAALVLGRKVVAAIRAPLRLSVGEIEIGASVGVAIFPEHGDDARLLLNLADQALNRAKSQGNVCIEAQPETVAAPSATV